MSKFYSPSEMAELCGVTRNALKLRAILVEKNGYEIQRNEKGHRMYTENDISVLYPKRVFERENTRTLNESINVYEAIEVTKKALEKEMADIEEDIINLEEEIRKIKIEVEQKQNSREKTAEMLKSIQIYLG